MVFHPAFVNFLVLRFQGMLLPSGLAGLLLIPGQTGPRQTGHSPWPSVCVEIYLITHWGQSCVKGLIQRPEGKHGPHPCPVTFLISNRDASLPPILSLWPSILLALSIAWHEYYITIACVVQGIALRRVWSTFLVS